MQTASEGSQKYRGEKRQTEGDTPHSSVYGSWTLSRHRQTDTIRFIRRHTSEDKANASEQVFLVDRDMEVGHGGGH